jgi:trigger factor
MGSASISTTVTELPESRVRVLAEVAPDEVQRSIERAARQLGRNLRVAGFRKGKVPPPVVIQRLGRATVVERAVQDGLKRWWRAALDDAGIAPVGQPKLDVTSTPADGGPLEFAIEIGVRPAAELGPYRGLEVGRREAEIEPGAVDAELQLLREGLARPEAVARPAHRGDLLIIDFEGLIDGEPFDGGRGRDQMVELGSGMLIAGFEEQLEGATAGELRTVHIDFPADVDSPKDHRAEDVAGSRASFEVKVKDVLAKTLPELDDALAQQAAGCDTLDELREDIASELLAADEGRIAEEFAETVLDAVATAAAIDLPGALVAGRAREIWESTLRTLDFDGVSKDVYLQISGKTEEQALAELHPRAGRELRREAVVMAIAEAEGIVVDDEELRASRPAADPAEGPAQPRSEVARREELLRERVLALLSREAVAISIEDAQAHGKPWPGDHEQVEPELPEPEVPPQSGELGLA